MEHIFQSPGGTKENNSNQGLQPFGMNQRNLPAIQQDIQNRRPLQKKEVPRYAGHDVHAHVADSKRILAFGGTPQQVNDLLINTVIQRLESSDSGYPVFVINLDGGGSSEGFGRKVREEGYGTEQAPPPPSLLLSDLSTETVADVLSSSVLESMVQASLAIPGKGIEVMERLLKVIDVAPPGLEFLPEQQRERLLKQDRQLLLTRIHAATEYLTLRKQNPLLTSDQHLALDEKFPDRTDTYTKDWLVMTHAYAGLLKGRDKDYMDKRIVQDGRGPFVGIYSVPNRGSNPQQWFRDFIVKCMQGYIGGEFPDGKPQELVVIGAGRIKDETAEHLLNTCRDKNVRTTFVYTSIPKSLAESGVVDPETTFVAMQLPYGQAEQLNNTIGGFEEAWKETNRDFGGTTEITTQRRSKDRRDERKGTGLMPEALIKPETTRSGDKGTHWEKRVEKRDFRTESLQREPVLPPREVSQLPSHIAMVLRIGSKPIRTFLPHESWEDEGTAEQTQIVTKYHELEFLAKIGGFLTGRRGDQKRLPERTDNS